MKYNDLISVVIPLYNAEQYIEKTLLSVLNQTYKFFEVIIVDDCSTDNSLKIVESFAKKDSRIKIIKRAYNFGGPAAPRNNGIKAAKGEFIAFLDSDDIWFKNKLEVTIKTLSKHPNIDVFYHNENHISVDGQEKVYKFAQIENSNAYEFLLYGNHIANSSAVVRRIELFRVDCISEDRDFISSEDYDLWLRLAMVDVFFYRCKEVLGERKYRKDSISADREKHSFSFFNVYKKHIKYIYEAKEITLREYLYYIYLFFFFKNIYSVKKEFSKGDYFSSFKKFLIATKKSFTFNIFKIKFCINFILKRQKALKEGRTKELF